MRRYAQFCPVARALDLVGERWVLLIVRELLIRPCRFTDLREGLPGIASNLLVDRLRALEEAGVVERAELPPPAASAIYRLTERGRGLLPIVMELARWGAPLLASGQDDDRFFGRWLVLPAAAALQTVATSDLVPLAIELRLDDEPIGIDLGPNGVAVGLDRLAHPDVVVTTDAMTAGRVLKGRLELVEAREGGAVRMTGEPAALALFETLLERLKVFVRESELGGLADR